MRIFSIYYLFYEIYKFPVPQQRKKSKIHKCIQININKGHTFNRQQ